jgi:hypothetical protein
MRFYCTSLVGKLNADAYREGRNIEMQKGGLLLRAFKLCLTLRPWRWTLKHEVTGKTSLIADLEPTLYVVLLRDSQALRYFECLGRPLQLSLNCGLEVIRQSDRQRLDLEMLELLDALFYFEYGGVLFGFGNDEALPVGLPDF